MRATKCIAMTVSNAATINDVGNFLIISDSRVGPIDIGHIRRCVYECIFFANFAGKFTRAIVMFFAKVEPLNVISVAKGKQFVHCQLVFVGIFGVNRFVAHCARSNRWVSC